MKKLFVSLASIPLFSGFAVAYAAEPIPLDEPTTLDAATLDDITAAGSGDRWKKSSGDNNQTNYSVLSPQTNVAVQVGVLSIQSIEQSNFQGNIND